MWALKVLVDVTFTIAISDYLLMQLDQSVNCIDKTTLSNLEALSLNAFQIAQNFQKLLLWDGYETEIAKIDWKP